MIDVVADSPDSIKLKQIADHLHQAITLADSVKEPLLGAKLHDCLIHAEDCAAKLSAERR